MFHSFLDPLGPAAHAPLDLATALLKVGIAFGLGLLIGLQRERVKSQLGGIRTFPLLGMFGAVAALLAMHFGGWILGMAALGVAAVLVVGNVAKMLSGQPGPGITTEAAALLTFGIGAYVVVGYVELAIAMGGAVAVLLHLKAPLHEFVERIGETDLKAIMQFVVITLVILPVLPNVAYDRFGVLNPHEIWLMVVLIVGISLGGYVAMKVFGQGAGTVLSGLLGGLVSSTATTASYARRTVEAPQLAVSCSQVIVLASTVSIARVLVELAIVGPSTLATTAPPILTVLIALGLLAAAAFLTGGGERSEPATPANPAELRTALVFGCLYVGIKFAVALAHEYLGSLGAYVVAILSGLTDMDAITLSTAQLMEKGQLATEMGWRLILVAALANLTFKGCMVAALGSRHLSLRVGILFAIGVVVGVLVLSLWP